MSIADRKRAALIRHIQRLPGVTGVAVRIRGKIVKVVAK